MSTGCRNFRGCVASCDKVFVIADQSREARWKKGGWWTERWRDGESGSELVESPRRCPEIARAPDDEVEPELAVRRAHERLDHAGVSTFPFSRISSECSPEHTQQV
jgi:hypothetical protein